MSEQSGEVDYALVAFLEDGDWQVQDIASPAFDSVESLSHALRQVLRRGRCRRRWSRSTRTSSCWCAWPASTTRVLLSDVTAADEWELAQSVVDFLGLPPPEDDDVEVPAGDLDLLADLGLHAIDMGALLDDVELYPDDVLSDIARRLGFGELFDDAVGLTSA